MLAPWVIEEMKTVDLKDTRSPVRPNLLALSLCKILSAKGNVVEVEKIDALAGTPVLDLKPFLPGYDSASDVRLPQWAGPK